MRLLILILALLIAGVPAQGQNCPDGKCPLVPSRGRFVPSPAIDYRPAPILLEPAITLPVASSASPVGTLNSSHCRWVPTESGTDFFVGNLRVGNLNSLTGIWAWAEGDARQVQSLFNLERFQQRERNFEKVPLPDSTTPISLPTGVVPNPGGLPTGVLPAPIGQQIPDFGMGWQGSKSERFSSGGKEISKESAYQSLTAGSSQIPADHDLFRITVIGSESERKQALADIGSSPELRYFRDRSVVAGFAPDAPRIRDAGFVTTGKPTIYFQKPDGAVLHRQDSYDGPDSFASALRKADPNYDPSRDADRRKVDPARPEPAAGGVSPLLVLAGAVAVFLVLRKVA